MNKKDQSTALPGHCSFDQPREQFEELVPVRDQFADAVQIGVVTVEAMIDERGCAELLGKLACDVGRMNVVDAVVRPDLSPAAAAVGCHDDYRPRAGDLFQPVAHPLTVPGAGVLARTNLPVLRAITDATRMPMTGTDMATMPFCLVV